MQIVIKLEDELLERINSSDPDDFDGWIESDLIQLIQDGTPLPKNHGRLIDADEMVKHIKPWTGSNAPTKYIRDRNLEFIHYLQNAETVLDAERREDET